MLHACLLMRKPFSWKIIFLFSSVGTKNFRKEFSRTKLGLSQVQENIVLNFWVQVDFSLLQAMKRQCSQREFRSRIQPQHLGHVSAQYRVHVTHIGILNNLCHHPIITGKLLSKRRGFSSLRASDAQIRESLRRRQQAQHNL